MDNAELKGRLAALEQLVRVLLKEHVRDPEKLKQLLFDVPLMAGTTPEWMDRSTTRGQEAATHYRTALHDWPGRLSADRPRSR